MNSVYSTEHFQTTIAAQTPTLVLFGSPTCPYCRAQKPLVEAFGRKYPRITTLFVDTNLWPEIATRRRITGLPTLAVYRGGKQLKRESGLHTGTQVEKFVEEALA